MRPFRATTMRAPPNNKWTLSSPEWSNDGSSVDFYIPKYFNPDEFVRGIYVSNPSTEDYVEFNLNYHITTRNVILTMWYKNKSGIQDGYDDFETIVNLTEDEKKFFQIRIENDWYEFIEKG